MEYCRLSVINANIYRFNSEYKSLIVNLTISHMIFNIAKKKYQLFYFQYFNKIYKINFIYDHSALITWFNKS